MFKRAVDALREQYDLKVIDIQIQRNLGESGRFSLKKVLDVFALLFGTMIPLASSEKFDILYYCLSGPSRLGLIKDLIFLSILRHRARKVVYHLHGAGGLTLLMKSNALLRGWARLVLFEPDLVLRPASPLREGDLCKAKCDIVVDNGIEDPNIAGPKSAQKWPDGGLSFAFIGLVTEEKGVFDLVEIARCLRDGGYRFTLSIVGEGERQEIAQLKDVIRRYDLAEFVRMPGVLVGEQKSTLLNETTIFLFPTYFRAETQPTAIMEALAFGVPVVAYDWRGIESIIEQGVNGYLVPTRDTDAFYRAIQRILTDGNIERMRIHARRIYLERFTLERHVEKLLLAFQSVDNE